MNMTSDYSKSIDDLSSIQLEATNWNEGSALVLAGPGAGKTRVLTTRIARILHESQDQRFRILALTYTTKAAAEMLERVEILSPDSAEDRTFIGTFHAFCTQILRQHGSHIGIQSDFGIIGQLEEQRDLLAEALESAIASGQDFIQEDIEYLSLIKTLKKKVISTEKVQNKNPNPQLKKVYQLYESTLRLENLIDFEGLILECCKLLSKMPALAKNLRRVYRYWMIDEFQDTTIAQYWFLFYLSGGEFQNIFVVADDDQIIYQWAGASYKQIVRFRKDYNPKLIQLVENHRCPPEIVTMANLLVSYNKERSPDKRPIIPGKDLPLNAISFHVFESDEEEQNFIVRDILAYKEQKWGDILILGRTRSILGPILKSLTSKGIKATLAQRRDNFISPQFIWWQACLDQALRPTNKRTFATLTNAANSFIEIDYDSDELIAEASILGDSYFEYWARKISIEFFPLGNKLGLLTLELAHTRNNWREITAQVLPILCDNSNGEVGIISDVEDDYRAWQNMIKEIKGEIGQELDLADVVQGIALRSKEPPKDPVSVSLMTVHAAKGLEFDYVYLVGLAEDELPSWQSIRRGDNSPEMEEERRNCFVAVTRTKEKLTLTTAKKYRNYNKKLSRFLTEMALVT